MKTPLISIIIPTYNSAETITQCLESIVSQQFKDFEILIIDALSGDNTLDIVKSYKDKGLDINLVSEKDAGIYDAMNKGIKMAKGEWVYFLGSDDKLFNEDVLSKVAAGITKDTDVIYGDSIWLPENVKEEGEWEYTMLLKKSINHQRVFYKRSLFEKLGYFNLSYKISADHALNILFFCEQSTKKKYIKLPVAYYNSGGFSSNKIDEQFWDDWKKVLLKNFRIHLPEKEIYKSIAWYCWYNIHKKKYAKAAGIFRNVFSHTYSMRFVVHTLSQAKKALINSPEK